MVRKAAEAGTGRQPRTRRTPKPLQRKIDEALAALGRVKAGNAKTAQLFSLLRSWLQDESGYDERVAPQLKKALDRERARAGARRLFDG